MLLCPKNVWITRKLAPFKRRWVAKEWRNIWGFTCLSIVFKEISPNSVNVKDLPAGCVIVFDRGMYKYSDDYGHVEITTGDGRGVSDGVTTDLRKPSAIFMPV